MATATVGNALLDIYLAPKALFNGLKSAKGWSLFAFALILITGFGTTMYFYSGMSTEWIVEQQLLQAGDISPSEEEQFRAIFNESAGSVGILGGIFQSLFLVLFVSLMAGYYRLVCNQYEDYTYGDWFSFFTWTQMPNIVMLLGFAALVLTASTPDLPLMLINYASINQLILGLSPSDALYTWAESINLFYLWSITLSVIGLKAWCQMSSVKAVLISTMPYFLVFGIWGVLA